MALETKSLIFKVITVVTCVRESKLSLGIFKALKIKGAYISKHQALKWVIVLLALGVWIRYENKNARLENKETREE